jgi:hypothetical protein
MQTIRARVAFHSRQHGFDKRMQQILTPDQPISGTQLAELYAFWGDPLSARDEQFLRSCLAEASAARGPILLAGANLLTLVLGALCTKDPQPGRQVWCLESDRQWANVIRSWLTEYRISGAHVIQSPARLFDDYVWYSVDTKRLAKGYQLLICDGARSTPRGALGAISRIDDRLEDRFTLLARNVKEHAVMHRLNDWARANDAKFALIDKQEGFLKVSRQPPAVSESATAATPAQRPGMVKRLATTTQPATPPTEPTRSAALPRPDKPAAAPAAAPAAGKPTTA